MPNYTPNLNLEKPLQTEFYNIDVPNSNMDILDSSINSLRVLLGKRLLYSNAINSSVVSVPQNVWTPMSLPQINNGIPSESLARFSASDNSVELLRGGFYIYIASGSIFNLPKGNSISVRINTNNSPTSESHTSYSQGNPFETSTTVGVSRFNVGDKLKLEIKHDATASLSSDLNKLTLIYLREVL